MRRRLEHSGGAARGATALAAGALAAVAAATAHGSALGPRIRFASAPKPLSCVSAPAKLLATVGHPVTLTWQLSPATRSSAVLQGSQGSGWSMLARATAAGGRLAFTFAPSAVGVTTLRVSVAASHGAPAVTSAPVALTAIAAAAPASSFRAVDAIPSDRRPDDPDGIVCDINAADDWFSTQTDGGVQPRWLRTTNADGTVGSPAILVVHLPRTAAQYEAAPDELALLEQDLQQVAPLAAATEKTAVWIDATWSRGCGVTNNGFSFFFEAGCGGDYPSTRDIWPNGVSYLVAHELTHNFGAVPACAPHYDGTGHVDDDPRDVLYRGSQDRDWAHLMLDPGHDDYYDTGRPGCPGIESSPFWTTPSESEG